MKEIRNKAEPFIRTYEWQDVEEGQLILPGLYVRRNLQTGKTEARLDRRVSDNLISSGYFFNWTKVLPLKLLEREIIYHYNFSWEFR